MPILYRKRDRYRLHAVDLNKLKNKLISLGYTYVREGGFTPEDEPFEYSNYIFYKNENIKRSVRIGHYRFFGKNIFELCYANEDDKYWRDTLPDYRKPFWKEVMKDEILWNQEWRTKKNK